MKHKINAINIKIVHVLFPYVFAVYICSYTGDHINHIETFVLCGNAYDDWS